MQKRDLPNKSTNLIVGADLRVCPDEPNRAHTQVRPYQGLFNGSKPYFSRYGLTE